jgi:hypothetical protein
MILCEWDVSEGHPGQSCIHLYARILSTSFTSVSIFSVWVSAHSAGEYTVTLLVMVIVVKGGGRAPPTLTSQANFTLMMECTPESGRYHSVYSVVSTACCLR